MPPRYFLLLTSATLVVAPSALADQSSLQSSIEQSQSVVQSQTKVNYPRRIESSLAPSNLQEVEQNQFVSKSGRSLKPDQASLLGEPQQIQLPFTSTTVESVLLESSQNSSPEVVSGALYSQSETTNSSYIKPQTNTEDDLSICTRAESFQTPPVSLLDQPLNEIDKLPVRQVEVSGNTVLQNEINEIIKDCRNRLLAPEQRNNLADAITRLYLNRDYITSRAVLQEPKGSAQDGYILPIRVIEGSLERIEVVTVDQEGKETDSIGLLIVRPRYICQRIQAGLGIPLDLSCDNLKPVKGNPLNTRRLEEQVRLLSLDPFIRNINPVLKSGTGNGQSVLRVEVEKPKFLNFSFNNYSPPSIGAQRAEIGLLFGSLISDGDIISASFSVDPFNFSATRGFNSFNLGYRLPLSPRDNTLQLRLEARREKIVQEPFDQFDFQAESELYEVVYRHPLIRSYSNEFALSVGFTYQNGQTFVFNDTPFPFGIGPDAEGVSRTSVVKFTQEYIHRGEYVTWAVRSQFNFGTGLFGATSNPDPIPDGKFFSWLGQAQRVQRLFNNLLVVQAEVQLSPNSLLPSQQFVIGGGQSLRGYRQNIRFGDNGFRFSTEYRLNLITRSRNDGTKEPTLQIAPFFDAGLVWNRSDNPNKLPKQTFLAGVGTGLLWQTPLSGLTVRVDYAFPLVDLRDEGNNIQDNGLYFTINYQL